MLCNTAAKIYNTIFLIALQFISQCCLSMWVDATSVSVHITGCVCPLVVYGTTHCDCKFSFHSHHMYRYLTCCHMSIHCPTHYLSHLSHLSHLSASCHMSSTSHLSYLPTSCHMSAHSSTSHLSYLPNRLDSNVTV